MQTQHPPPFSAAVLPIGSAHFLLSPADIRALVQCLLANNRCIVRASECAVREVGIEAEAAVEFLHFVDRVFEQDDERLAFYPRDLKQFVHRIIAGTVGGSAQRCHWN